MIPSLPPRRYLASLTTMCAITPVLLGAIVLFGWYSHNAILVQLSPSLVPMQYNTALGFLASGFGLLALSRALPKFVKLMGFTILTIGGMTLIQYTFGVGLGIDQVFMEHYITVATSHPGRMAPNTALCFLLAGFALLAPYCRGFMSRDKAVTGVAGILILGLGLIAFGGYVMGLETAYGWGQLTRMALHTSIGFIVLGIGLTSCVWAMDKDEARSPRWLPVGVGLGIFVISITLWQALTTSKQEVITNYVVLLFGTTLSVAIAVALNSMRKSYILHAYLEKINETLESRVEEQIKELNCLYTISEIFNRQNIDVDAALQTVIERIPLGWHYPDIACARLTYNGRTFATKNFQESSYRQFSPVTYAGKKVGEVEVCYLDDQKKIDNDPFLKEEESLIITISSVIGSYLHRKENAAKAEETDKTIIHAALGAINALSATIEKRDPYTSGHQKRVSQLSVAIAADLGWDDQRIEGLRIGALVHDIGKIYIPAEILNRPGKLSDPEFAMIKAHPLVGFEIMEHTEFPWPIQEMILQHHERIDGTGYPSGLKGEHIIDEAKVIAIADVVEAITSHRPYRAAKGIEAGLEEIEREKGAAFDPEMVDSCIKVIRQQGFNWS